jgi:hypothetical protein
MTQAVTLHTPTAPRDAVFVCVSDLPRPPVDPQQEELPPHRAGYVSGCCPVPRAVRRTSCPQTQIAVDGRPRDKKGGFEAVGPRQAPRQIIPTYGARPGTAMTLPLDKTATRSSTCVRVSMAVSAPASNLAAGPNSIESRPSEHGQCTQSRPGEHGTG